MRFALRKTSKVYRELFGEGSRPDTRRHSGTDLRTGEMPYGRPWSKAGRRTAGMGGTSTFLGEGLRGLIPSHMKSGTPLLIETSLRVGE